MIDHFAKKYHCIAPDLPGHGKTIVKGSPTDYTMEAFAGFFRRFLGTLGVLQSSLIGYSMGGRLALFLAVHFPTLWETVILESVSPGLRTEKERLERQKKDAKIAGKLENEPLDKFLKYWYQQPLFDTIKKNKNFPLLFLKRLENDPYSLANSLRMMGLGKQPSLWKAGARMEIPILLLTGEFDRKFCNILKEAHSTFLHSGIPPLIDAVYTKASITILILDNSSIAMTGFQPTPASGKGSLGEPAPAVDIAEICLSCGASSVITVDPYDTVSTLNALKHSANIKGVSIVISRRPCALKSEKAPPFRITSSCTSCGECLKLACPSLHKDPFRIDSTCTGCGICAQACPRGAIKR